MIADLNPLNVPPMAFLFLGAIVIGLGCYGIWRAFGDKP